MAAADAPLTLGTAGHVDHGKTALVAALTGIDTDRLPAEKARGLTIELGYAPLILPSGRRLSLIDVPGHARFVRTMVSGATGVDLYLMVVAADDGVMPQTVEHAQVLSALGVEKGVVAVTKSDLADPRAALAQVAELLPGIPAVACSVRTGEGLEELSRALERVVVTLPSRAARDGPARLHIDRVFTITGRGTVITGTLWSGAIARGDALELLPRRAPARVRGVEVHDRALERAHAGQRVAVNLVGVRGNPPARGDVLATPGAFEETTILDCALELQGEIGRAERVQVMHGTRAVAGRMIPRGPGLWQLRLERALVAASGDMLVVRRLAPPEMLGGGVVIEARARRRRPVPKPAAPPAAQRPAGEDVLAEPGARELEQRLREAGAGLLSEAQIDAPRALRALCGAELATRVSGRLYGHAETVESVRAQLVALIEAEGPITLAGARDALGISRKAAQAFLEHLDNERVTRRLPDDTRVLRARAAAGERVSR